MKSLQQYLNESLVNEGIFTFFAGSLIFLILLFIDWVVTYFNSLNGRGNGGYAITSLNPFKQIAHNGGVVVGLISWCIEVHDHLNEYSTGKKVQAYIDTVKNSDEFNAWANGPKKKRTLKALKDVVRTVLGAEGKNVNFATWELWDEYKNKTKTDPKLDEFVYSKRELTGAEEKELDTMINDASDEMNK